VSVTVDPVDTLYDEIERLGYEVQAVTRRGDLAPGVRAVRQDGTVVVVEWNTGQDEAAFQ
jgi:hypothetical protein